MPPLSRRRFAQLAGSGAAAVLAAPYVARAAQPRVVVIGGGAGGATAAKYIAQKTRGAIEVVLIEPSKTYHTCFFSNLYLGGFRSYASLNQTYAKLASAYGVRVVHDRAEAVDRDHRLVRLASGPNLPYDRLIVSPGIDFVEGSVPGLTLKAAAARAPHAWKAGPQLQRLKAQVLAMKQGGTFVMVPPPDPSRCPTGPYERVSMIAHVFRRHNPSAKIVILDPKEKFSKQALFQTGWASYYAGMIQWLPPSITGGLLKVDIEQLQFTVDLDTFKADAASIIPAQRAGRIAQMAGLTDATGWCPVVPATMRSTIDDNVYVIGDAASAAAMPKSASAANSQAKVAARAVCHALLQSEMYPARFLNTCCSLIAPNDGVKVGATYKAGTQRIEPVHTFISQNDEPAALRKQTYEEAIAWYDSITADIFGCNDPGRVSPTNRMEETGMKSTDRRGFLALASAAGLSSMLPAAYRANAKAQTMIKTGGIEISTYSDGFLTLPPDMFATNVDTAQRAKALQSAGQIGTTVKSPINVTLVRNGKNLIMIDAGSGSRFMSTAGRLAAELEGAGIDPKAVTHVVYTHAHPDHIWGTTDDFDELSFPNAIPYISEAEWAFWTAEDAINRMPKDRQSFVVGAQRNLEAIKDRIKLMKPGQDVVTGVHILATFGHTPGHVSIEVGTGNDRVVVLGDALTHPVISFEHPEWHPASDQLPDQAVTTRIRLLAKLAADRTRIIGYHLPPPGLGYVEKKANAYIFVSVTN